jgi:hypothetical protein
MRATKFAQIGLAAGLACAAMVLAGTSHAKEKFIRTPSPRPGCIILDFTERPGDHYRYPDYVDEGSIYEGTESEARWYCPPKKEANIIGGTGEFTNNGFPPLPSGLNVGGFVSGGRSQNTFIETFAATGEETSRNAFGDTRVSGGGHVGFVIPWVTHSSGSPNAPGVGPILIEPFIQIEDPNTHAQFNFPGGSFIGVQSDFEVTTGVKVGPSFHTERGDFWVFGTAGASFENEKLIVNFVPTSSSESKTISGFTTGFGISVMPNGLRLFGLPTAVSVEYQHTSWQTAHFNMPASSPLFNYAFQRDDDKILVGAKVFFGAPFCKDKTFFFLSYQGSCSSAVPLR